MSELLPCPFCGGEVKIETYRDEGYIISCKHHDWPKREINKDIEPECIAGDIDLCSWGLGDKARNALIAAWNSRAKPPCGGGDFVHEEIVRCRDCKHCETVEGMFGGESLACGRFDDATVKPDGFCAWGELRGDAE